MKTQPCSIKNVAEGNAPRADDRALTTRLLGWSSLWIGATMADVKHPFIVNVSPIKGYVGSTEEVERGDVLDELQTSGAAVPADVESKFVGRLEAIDGGIVAQGQVVSRWAGDCRRCLGPATGDIVAEVREVFEDDPTEGETYPLQRDHVDLEPLVREVVMLELPVAPLCKDDCAGLCPTCGINRNESTCGCTSEVGDPRWAALDVLKEQGTD